MLTINITQEFEDAMELAETLPLIAELIEQGETSGEYPHWSLEEEEEN